MRTVTAKELGERLREGEKLRFLDVRTPAEHAEIHARGVHPIPLDQLDPATLASVKGFAKDQPLYIFCRSGSRAKQAAEKLEKSGYQQCQVVEGGTMAWAEAGLPVTRGTSKVISLERQARIAASAIVLAGVLLAQSRTPPSFGSRASWARDLFSPASPTGAVWGCLSPSCRGTSAAAEHRAPRFENFIT